MLPDNIEKQDTGNAEDNHPLNHCTRCSPDRNSTKKTAVTASLNTCNYCPEPNVRMIHWLNLTAQTIISMYTYHVL